jgi:hypothetical protein
MASALAFWTDADHPGKDSAIFPWGILSQKAKAHSTRPAQEWASKESFESNQAHKAA